MKSVGLYKLRCGSFISGLCMHSAASNWQGTLYELV